jgi:uncharacterized protein YuzE
MALTQENLDYLKLIPVLKTLPKRAFQMVYDYEADVLYISFRKPQNANDSVLEDSLIYHYHDQDLVGITVLNASQLK